MPNTVNSGFAGTRWAPLGYMCHIHIFKIINNLSQESILSLKTKLNIIKLPIFRLNKMCIDLYTLKEKIDNSQRKILNSQETSQ